MARSRFYFWAFLGFSLLSHVTASLGQPPATIAVQGVVQSSGGGALTGARDYRIRFFDSATAGSQLGSNITGTVTLSGTGRFSIELTPPSEIFSVSGVWYDVAVDSTATPNGIDANDLFPDRVKVTSVPFARQSGDALTLAGTPASQYSTDAEREAAIASAVADLVTSPSAPSAPTHLRIVPSLRAAPFRRLMWNVEDFAGTTNFVVHESSAPITDDNKASALKRFVSTTELELAFYGNSGVRHFRVAAVNFAGVEGALSNEFALDTTLRLAYIADEQTDNVNEVFSVRADGTGRTKVNASFLT
ncbi:MAG: hypothetical protein V2A74_12430, partial [bacterium]